MTLTPLTPVPFLRAGMAILGAGVAISIGAPDGFDGPLSLLKGLAALLAVLALGELIVAWARRRAGIGAQ